MQGAIWEPFETEVATREIRSGDTVLDLGANIGYYTLLFSELVGDKGRVFAFEPDPANFALLMKNIQANGCRNVTAVPRAVSNKSGFLNLYHCDDDAGDHRVYDSGDGRSAIEVECVRLNDYFAPTERIDFIKMDLQGAEWGAIEGASQLIRNNPDLKIISEYWPKGLKISGIDPADYPRMLMDQGFTLFRMSELDKTLERVHNAEALSREYSPELGDCTNLFCIRLSSCDNPPSAG
jgi:FkbM family methyltransferase